MSTKASLNIFDTKEELGVALAEQIAETAQAFQKSKGYFAMALSGGSSPRPLYEALATPPLSYKVPWSYGYFFMVDERCVPESSKESNFKMIWECMLSHVPVFETNIFPVHFQTVDPERAATDYEDRIKEAFKLEPGAFPAFDIVILGLGDDGHTASLFPNSDALKETERAVVANHVDRMDQDRITLTVPTLNNSEHIFFVVTGQSKADIVSKVMCATQPTYPANLIQPPKLQPQWYLDKEAASLLSPAACHSGEGGSSTDVL